MPDHQPRCPLGQDHHLGEGGPQSLTDPGVQLLGDEASHVVGLDEVGESDAHKEESLAVTQDAQVGEVDLKSGDVLYAIVDDVDSRGQLFLRATKVISAETKEATPLTLSAMNPVTGLLGLPVPKNLQAGWRVQWKTEF